MVLTISWIFLISMADIQTPPTDFISPGIRSGRYLFLEPSRRGPVSLVCAGWESCEPGFSVDRPSFRYHAIELLAGGTWEIRTGKHWIPTASGTVFLYGPGKHGGVRTKGKGPHHKYFADFTGPQASRTLKAAGLEHVRAKRLANPDGLLGLYEQIISCSNLPKVRGQHLADLLLNALLERTGAERVATESSSSRSHEVFDLCRSYLVENYPRIRHISEAARHCRVSPEYFSRLFRKHAGQSAQDFLTRLRINHAAKLLQRSSMTVKAAGEAVGFDDPYHFSRVFKKVHGTAPRDFTRGAER
jgi:AraC-like DNA-binding protein